MNNTQNLLWYNAVTSIRLLIVEELSYGVMMTDFLTLKYLGTDNFKSSHGVLLFWGRIFIESERSKVEQGNPCV